MSIFIFIACILILEVVRAHYNSDLCTEMFLPSVKICDNNNNNNNFTTQLCFPESFLHLLFKQCCDLQYQMLRFVMLNVDIRRTYQGRQKVSGVVMTSSVRHVYGGPEVPYGFLIIV